MMTPEQDPLARATSAPDLTTLIDEFQRARDSAGMVERLAAAEDLRFTRWPGQSDDGLKHQSKLPRGTKVRPWEGAFDTRQPVADDVINGITDLLTVSFWNSRVRTQPVYGSTMTSVQASELRKVLTWVVHGALGQDLREEVELAAQGASTVGHAVIYAGWREEYALKTQQLTLEGVLGAAQAGDPASQLWGALVLDPAAEEAAAAMLQEMVPYLKLSRAKRVVRELRESGTAEFPVRQRIRNLPEVTVLRPGDDVFVPPETTDLKWARVIFRRVWMTAQMIEAEGTTAGWSEKFIQAARDSAGAGAGMDYPTGFAQDTSYDMRNLAEIVYAYTRSNDADGVPGIYCTVFCPQVTEETGLHHLLPYGHGQYPFTAFRLEAASRRLLDSRGVPETFISTAQNEMKCAHDAIADRTQLELKPPVVRSGAHHLTEVTLGPDARIAELVPNEVRWMEPPRGSPDLAFKLIEVLQNRIDDYWGRMSEHTPPAVTQMRQQRLVNRWLSTWSGVLHQCLVMVYQYFTPEELEGLIGHEPSLTADVIAANRVMFWYDVRSLQSEWLIQFVEAMNQFILPADAGGVVDRSKYVRWLISYFDPTLADEITTDQEGATEALFKSVRDELLAIQSGNEPLLNDASNDASAGMKMQYANQIWTTNQQLQQAAQSQPQVRERLEKYMANLDMAVKQQQNKQIGRIGVNPEETAR